MDLQLANRLQRHRKAHGYSQEALAAAESALNFEPNNVRIKDNAEFFRKELAKA